MSGGHQNPGTTCYIFLTVWEWKWVAKFLDFSRVKMEGTDTLTMGNMNFFMGALSTIILVPNIVYRRFVLTLFGLVLYSIFSSLCLMGTLSWQVQVCFWIFACLHFAWNRRFVYNLFDFEFICHPAYLLHALGWRMTSMYTNSGK